ncbi:MAG: hypothetical protein QNJ55_27100 [Xenococcus sp. MO_188.B8]|nr:hypothetical protein [Xenococcus sp. MO_188.B8]
MTEQEQLTQILSLLNKLDDDVRQTNRKVEETNQKIEATNRRLEEEARKTNEQFQKWDDRYFQLVKDQGNTARTIIIAAASVVVLSPVLEAVAELVNNYFR